MAGITSTSTLSNNFKIRYGKVSDDTFDSSNPLQAMIKVEGGFTGTRYADAVPTGFGGSVGAGTLPRANSQPLQLTDFDMENVYGRLEIDRKSMKLSAKDQGAFFRLYDNQVKQVVKSFSRMMEMIWFGDGTGALGTIDTGGVTASAPTYVCVISAATWLEARFEEKDYVNVGTSTDLFEVTVVAPATRAVTLVRITGSTVPADGDVIYLQGARNAVPQGLKGVCDATSSTKYGISIGRRWQSVQVAASSASLDEDILNDAVLKQQKATGQVPKMGMTSFTQMRKLLALHEGQKRYTVGVSRRDDYGSKKAQLSFSGVELMTPEGPIPVYASRFCENDRFYLLNQDYIKQVRADGWGWFEDDGTVILRMAESDAYEARYGGYCENYIMPPFQSVITGLAT